jgi:hypothetical protein
LLSSTPICRVSSNRRLPFLVIMQNLTFFCRAIRINGRTLSAGLWEVLSRAPTIQTQSRLQDS